MGIEISGWCDVCRKTTNCPHLQITFGVGRNMGCSDGAPPEDFTPFQLSRVFDMMHLAKELGVGEDVWKALPKDLKMDFIYAKWTYVSSRN